MGEREMLLALFKAVTGLAERLTGERMVVTVANEQGESFKLSGGDGVDWEQIVEASIPLRTTVNIDGRKVAEAVNKHAKRPK